MNASGFAVLRDILETIGRHFMFRPGDRVGVAVSGGADSVALLHALVELAPRWNLHLRVLHLNHLLRGDESGADARFVRELAAGLGLPIEAAEIDVARQTRESGGNLEQVARQARRGFFLDFIEHGQLDRVATGHTRSDQAETVLHRLLRGTGATGLVGILPVTREGFVRPLLDVTRDQVRAFLIQRSLGWREDSSNTDPRFARNRIRAELLPALRRDWNPSIEATLASLATLTAGEERFWESAIQPLAAEALILRRPAVLLSVDKLRDAPEALLRRLLRHAIRLAKGDLRRIDFHHLENLRDLTCSAEGRGGADLPGLTATRSFDWIRLMPPQPDRPAADYCLPVPVPGTVEIPGSSTALHCEPYHRRAENEGYNTVRSCDLDQERLPGPLEVRNWRPGDRFHPVEQRAARKMKELFERERIPSWERRGWPMLLSGKAVVWTRQFGAAKEFAAAEGVDRVLRVWEAHNRQGR